MKSAVSSIIIEFAAQMAVMTVWAAFFSFALSGFMVQ